MFTPLPPARTGTADYADALICELRKHVVLTVFEDAPGEPDWSHFDVVVYQIANNRWHSPFLELARAHPGIAVLHETELSCLPPGCGGEPASQYLAGCKAFIVHSDYAAARLRRRFDRPVIVIPHGVHLFRPLRDGAPKRTGQRSEIVVGMLGYQGAHKNLLAGARAFEFLARHEPRAVLWIGGDFEGSLAPPSCRDRVRFLGDQSAEDFEASLNACDVLINLRLPPTNGETSGILMRAFAAGLPVIVSDTGSFHELPDSICFKIPCDRFEQSVLNACLLRLAKDWELRRRVGSEACSWVEANCSWERVAAEYLTVIRSVIPFVNAPLVNARHWMAQRLLQADDPYVHVHFERLVRTLERIPVGQPSAAVLEMGCTLHITPALEEVLGYSEVRGCALATGASRRHSVAGITGTPLEYTLDYFDAERDMFPYATGQFNTVLCCELLEHLQIDPLQMLWEINRILKPGGTLVLSTPNAASFAALSALLHREHPGLYVTYVRPRAGIPLAPRHAREYAPSEIVRLLDCSGFALESLETIPYSSAQQHEFPEVHSIAAQNAYPCDLRDACILAIARKAGTPTDRFPAWLYDG